MLATNALPILAGAVLFGEGWGGPVRVSAFVLVLAGAVALSRREAGIGAEKGPRPARLVRLTD